MRTPQEWTRRYEELSQADFVPVPSYSLPILLRPLETLKNRVTQDEVDSITAKLYYSTRYFGKYDIDAGEYSGLHPGVDLKVAEGTPVAAIGGGRVHDVRTNATLGLHLLIEHRLQNGDGLFSIYGHLESSAVKKGEVVLPGQTIGTVGMTGNTTAPHLHLQLDRTEIGEAAHQPYWPAGATVSQNEADLHSPHPLTFIRRYGAGE
jgi:murein DD-endopeptidase MepM/ murein hydrolase activator NlpD